MMTDKPRRLGRGLEALLTPRGAPATTADQGEWHRIPIGDIRPNPHQPRKEFKPDELAELEASLKANGLLQPVAVRPAAGGAGYELIAGERRLRAAAQLGWNEIPAVIKEVDDRTLLTLALVENLQRTDLNPIEEAEGYQRLVDDFSLTQQQVADAVGKDRSTIANTLRLLNLPASVRRMVQDGALTLGHARALLALGSDREIADLAREVVARGLTVRDVERRAREAQPAQRKGRPRESRQTSQGNAQARLIEDQLRRRLQTDVRLVARDANRGVIEITFYSDDDLQRLLDLLAGDARETA